jgi:hypothetical protein
MITALIALLLNTWLLVGGSPVAEDAQRAPAGVARELFVASDRCMACHNGLVTPGGRDVSIGTNWRASMMANSARDPYWQAAVRREVLEHPAAQAAIENECSACHMPMARFEAKAGGKRGEIFAHLPIAASQERIDRLAADGVSCTMCHQIREDGLGRRESYTAGFAVDTTLPLGRRMIFGPVEVDRGRTRIMLSASEFQPSRALHIESSEFCATCHTLITHALGPDGKVVGELPEQVPYLEWKHSGYRDSSCQSCHMPALAEKTPFSSVLGEPREPFHRHEFQGGNFFMFALLNRYRDQLGVSALQQELDAANRHTVHHLQTQAARIAIQTARVSAGRLEATVSVTNLAGHKLPTAYPSRRAWIHLVVRDAAGGTVFESGSLARDGSVRGNDNDGAPTRFEPHYDKIENQEQVQIYESIMEDSGGAVTTGLLAAVRFVKDNRILPRGFDKETAGEDIAVRGGAAQDPDFAGGSDLVRYSVGLGKSAGPFSVEAELFFQPVGYRWARNLAGSEAAEMARFVSMYDSMAASGCTVIARAASEVSAEP